MSHNASTQDNTTGRNTATTQQDAALQGTVGEGDQYLTFNLGDEEYGVDILRVQEIRAWDTVTPLPNTPPYVKGVINMRGTIVPVIDLRERFGMEMLQYTQFTVVVLVRVLSGDRERIMGLIVDALSEVYGITEDQLRPPPDFGTVIRTDFIQGLATMEDKMVIILDVDRLLGEDADVGEETN
mgnify:CR=1 FL=1